MIITVNIACIDSIGLEADYMLHSIIYFDSKMEAFGIKMCLCFLGKQSASHTIELACNL